jgi:hypothetical protein
MYNCNDQLTGIVHRDMKESYNPKKDYWALVLRAYQGKTGDRTNGVPVPNERGRETLKMALQTRITDWNKVVVDDILRCQNCCMQHAFQHYEGFDLTLCSGCWDHNTIEYSKLTFVKRIRNSKRIRHNYHPRNLKSYGFCWIPDLEAEVVRCGYYDKSFAQLLAEDQKAGYDRRAMLKEYRTRQSMILAECFREHWEDSQYDKYREVLNDEFMRTQLLFVARRISYNLRLAKDDKPEKYIRDKVAEVLGALESPLTLRTSLLWDISMQRHVVEFHRQRFKQEFDAGDRTLPQYNSTDGLCHLSVCHICFRKAVVWVKGLPREKRTADYVSSFACSYPTDCRYKTAQDLIYHYLNDVSHLASLLSRKENEDREWFSFVTGVEGAEPVRVTSFHYDVPPAPLQPIIAIANIEDSPPAGED